jgi:hypothetical protein
MEEKYVFMLPSLLQENLCEDDSEHYSFLTFHRPEISEAAKIIVGLIGNDPSNVSTTSKKRVKILMEFFAVALSLKIADSKLMEVARSYYAQWLVDSSLFGDLKRQNKYICRIIRQLSLPFAFLEPKSSKIFSTDFLELIMNILGMLQKLCIERGKELEHQTWITLLNTSIGITDAIMNFVKIANLCRENEISELKMKAVELVFNVIQTSGILERADWERVALYCKKWSNQIDFLKVWGTKVVDLWKYVNCITYNLPIESIPIQGGVFTEDSPLPNDVAKLEFHNILVCIDYKKTAEKPDLLLQLANTVHQAKDVALNVAKQSSTGLEEARYPAYTFLKLFGRFITFTPPLDEKYDPAISTNISTLIDIIAKFEQNEVTEPTKKRFIAYMAQRTSESHMAVVSSFLNNAVTLYRQSGELIPFISGHTLKLINFFKNTKNDDKFVENLVSVYCSAAASSNLPKQVVEQSFEAVFKIVTGTSYRLRLLVSATSNGIDVFPMICNYLSPDKFKSIAAAYNFACGLITLVGVTVRANPETISRVVELDIIPTILSDVQILEIRAKKGFDHIAIAALQMLYELAQWSPSVFHQEKIVKSFFEFITFIQNEIKDEKNAEGAWFEKRKRIIQSLMVNLLNSVNIHIPALEFVTHKLCSASTLNEDAVVKYLGIEDPVINYFTVGNNLLISFIETKTGENPLAFFARGQFGKAVFQVCDDYTNGREPALSDEVQKTELPQCQSVEHIDLELKGEEAPNAPYITFQELDNVDQSLRDKYGKDFATWLDWNSAAYYTPFGYHAPYQRLRVVDFLTTFGILDVENKLCVRPQNDHAKVKEIIDRFDEIEAATILPIPIRHFLANDEDLSLTKQKTTRMTPLMLDFLRQIGEPMETSEKASELHNIPNTNTTIPCAPIFSSFVAFLTPGMGKTEEDATKIDEMYGKAPFSIIFNESGFDLNIQKEEKPSSFIIVVTPTIRGLYSVTTVQAPSDISSPFSQQQIMDAKALGLHITVALESMISSLYKTLTPPIAKKRGELIKELCSQDKVSELAALATGMFDEQ